MSVWWDSLGAAGKLFACVAIPSTVILLLQTLLMLIGIGGHDSDGDAADSPDDAGGEVSAEAHDGLFGDSETDVDHDGHGDDGLHWLSLRGCIAFLTVFGWVGVLCVRNGMPMILCALLAVTAGVLAMAFVALTIRWVYSLQTDGTENIRHAVGATGTVYLRIPPDRTGCGKINLLLDGRLVEKEAVTDDETQILYGEQVLVVGISGGNTLIVRKKS